MTKLEKKVLDRKKFRKIF